ncbi:MAG: TraR/DksA C4-type zinc finger protein [Nitrospirota bacterium]
MQNIDIEKIDNVLEEIWHAADRELYTATLGRLHSLFRNIRTALVRTTEDAFGVCLCCRRAIGRKRLQAVPWTPLCIRCQEAADRNDGEVLRSRSRS